MYDSYMDRTSTQYHSHQQYIREGIREEAIYTNGSQAYEHPYYQPGQVYDGGDGSTMIQDDFGQYHHYDAYG